MSLYIFWYTLNIVLLQVQQKCVDDEQLARDIAKQLGDIPGVSYSEIANKAIECDRKELAINVCLVAHYVG